MSKFWKITITILGIAILGGGLYWWFFIRTDVQQAQAAASQLETSIVEEGILTSTVDAVGTVRSKQNTLLVWKTSGTVEDVTVKAGDQVEAGDILATLSETSLPQNIIMAQADLVNAQKSLDDLYTNAESAKTSAMQSITQYAQAVRDAQYQLDNYTITAEYEDMTAMEALDITKQELDEARAAYEPYKYYPSSSDIREEYKDALDEAQSNYNAAVKRLEYEYELEVAENNLKKARADYEKYKNGPDPADIAAAEARIAAAEATIKLTYIEAPFDATITEAIPYAGDQVTANTKAFRLDNLSEVYIDVNIPEVDVKKIKEGQEATITIDAIRGKTYNGVVSEIARAGENNQGIVNFKVTVKLTKPDSEILPGMTAEVSIITSKSGSKLLVPNQALKAENGKLYVYKIIKGERPQLIEITIGDSSDTHSEVVSGELESGDLIVLNPAVFEKTQEEGGTPFSGMRKMRDAEGGSNSSESPPTGHPGTLPDGK